MQTDVLIVGAGPVGLMAAIELRCRGVDVVIVDKRADIAPWAKAALAAAYGFADAQATPAACLIRPDGYVGYRSSAVDIERLLNQLRLTLRL